MFHVKHEGWTDLAGSIGLELTGDQEAQLERYRDLLEDRAIPLGMVAADDAGRLRERHLLDSLRAAPLVQATDTTAYDLGSGAGLPGIPIAIARPSLQIGLVEPRRARAAFLELVARELSLGNVRVLIQPAAELRERVGLCFARAFGDARKAWSAAEPRLAAGGRLLYFAGERFDPASCPEGISVDIRTFPSLARSGPLVIMTRQ